MLNIKKTLTKILSFLGVEDIPDKITLTSAWTDHGINAYKVGKICVFGLRVYTSTYVGGTQYTVATIADGYRPRNTLTHTGHTTDANYVAKAVVNTFVWTSGDITVRASNNSGGFFFLSGWWILP